jgi:uncharacterized protein (DUF983 family)
MKLKRIIQFFLVFNIINVVMDYYVWFMYSFRVPSWVYATTHIGYMILIYCLLKLIK